MGRIYNNIVETVGRTPLVRLNKVTAGVPATAARDESIGLQPLQHLACGRPRDAEHLRDAGGKRRCAGGLRPVLADREREEPDRLEVIVD